MKFNEIFKGSILVENPTFMIVIEEHDPVGISLVPWHAVLQQVDGESIPTGEWRRGNNGVIVLCAEEMVALKQYLVESIPDGPVGQAAPADPAKPDPDCPIICICSTGANPTCPVGHIVGNHVTGSHVKGTTLFGPDGKTHRWL